MTTDKRNLFGMALCIWGAVSFIFPIATKGQSIKDPLANNTVLIIRHAEKPTFGTGLTAEGLRRASAYVSYFEHFQEGSGIVRVSALYAGADSQGSNRPRLTLEPLAADSGIKLNSSIETKDPAALVALLHHEPHGKVPLICWRHGQIPALLTSFGASPDVLLPNGKWPDQTYDWVVLLRFDSRSRLVEQRTLTEDFHRDQAR